jgi:hypothetical protein
MQKTIIVALRLLGMLFVAHALMLLGADEITTLEAGGIRTIRSLAQILTLYGADPKPWAKDMPAWAASIAMLVMSWPGWAVFAMVGGALGLAARPRD